MLINGEADADLKEGYRRYSKKNIKKLHEFYENIRVACDQIIAESKVLKKPRKKKFKSAEDLTKKVDRLILDYAATDSVIPNSVGSFGFGFLGKDWGRIIHIVNSSSDIELLRLHIPYSDFADPNGHTSTYIANSCRQLLDPRIHLNISHDFMSIPDLLKWLSRHSINIFPYEEMKGRGISSTIDFALSCRRPIGISKSDMFRHIYHKQEILLDNNSLSSIINSGISPLEDFYKWDANNLINQYDKILLKL
jgi:hypothetical protein